MSRILGGGYYRGADYRHRFIPSKKDAETCTFCGGSKKRLTQREPKVPVHTDDDKPDNE